MLQNKTFETVARENGLNGMMKDRYVQYMEMRWKEREEQMCLTEYAEEWCERFKSGCEYSASDCEGQTVLDIIDKQIFHKF